MLTRHRDLSCFKAYDIRGRVPEELDAELARTIGRAYAALRLPRRVVVGHDMRLTSPDLARAVAEGLTSFGVDVVDIGQCGTEMMSFAVAHLEDDAVDGGVMVTGSHNPASDNGLKLVGAGARPILDGSGLGDIRDIVAEGEVPWGRGGGTIERFDVMPRYVDALLRWVLPGSLRELTIVTNPGNGCAGAVIDALEERLPFRFVKMWHEPDGTFPNGVPNPLLGSHRAPTSAAVRAHDADLGLAWDGDFDRCFFFDEQGDFVEGYYMVGLIAQHMLAAHPGAKIVHDPRLTWNTIEMVNRAEGHPILSRAGHSFVKQRMREEDAVYGGEMSGHHYFREFAYCDSGMIPWLLLCGILSHSGSSLGELVREAMARYPASGEVNMEIAEPLDAVEHVRERYAESALAVDETDGLSIELEDWRFNVRASNTEPLLRLNVESRGDVQLMQDKTAELLALLRPFA